MSVERRVLRAYYEFSSREGAPSCYRYGGRERVTEFSRSQSHEGSQRWRRKNQSGIGIAVQIG